MAAHSTPHSSVQVLKAVWTKFEPITQRNRMEREQADSKNRMQEEFVKQQDHLRASAMYKQKADFLRGLQKDGMKFEGEMGQRALSQLQTDSQQQPPPT